MNPAAVISATQMGALLVATAGDLIGQGPQRTLPRPRMIAGVLVFYGPLHLAAGLGAGLAKLAAAAAAATFLVTLVGTGAKGTGVAGSNLVLFIQRTTQLLTGPQGGGGQ